MSAEALECGFEQWTNASYVRGGDDLSGVDCVRFAAAMLRLFTGRDPGPVPAEAQDGSYHDPRVLLRVEKWLMRSFSAKRIPISGRYVLGDCVGIATVGDPFHVAVVGRDGAAYHASSVARKVVRTSIVALCSNGYSIRRAYRCG